MCLPVSSSQFKLKGLASPGEVENKGLILDCFPDRLSREASCERLESFNFCRERLSLEVRAGSDQVVRG